jgi:hypothetical protein
MALYQWTKSWSRLVVVSLVLALVDSTASAIEANLDSVPPAVPNTTGQAAPESQESIDRFHPNITSDAETAGSGKVRWQPSQTELIPQFSFFSNNLSVGLGNRSIEKFY